MFLPNNPTGVIIAGGLGTRLGGALGNLPKTLAPVAGRPFLAHLLEQLASAGIGRVVLCTGHGGDMIEDFVAAKEQPLKVLCSREPEPLGTGGALRLALPLIESEVALVMNGDSYVDTDLAPIVEHYGSSASDAAMVLVCVNDTSRFGSVRVDDRSQITEFLEKRPGGGPGLINGGVYLLSADLIAAIAPDKPVSLERDLFPVWLETGLQGYPVDTGFIDIGTPASLAEAEAFFAGRAQP